MGRVVVWRPWLLVAHRQWGARRGLVGIVLLACLAPIALTVAASIASSSAAPRPGELAGRELGPYQMRVQADSLEELQRLEDTATSGGATRQAAVVTTPAVLVTPTDAAEVSVEAGLVDPALVESRFRLMAGRLPGGPNEIAVAQDAATALGLRRGSHVQWHGSTYTVSGILRQRGDFQSRTALISTSASSAQQELGDPSRTHYDLYLAGAADPATLQDTYLRNGYGVLSRVTGADQVQHSDGEFVSLLRRMAAGLLVLSILSVVACMALIARLVEGDLHTLDLLGFTRRSRMLLSGSVGLLLGLVAVVVGLLVGVPTALAARGFLERLLGAEWYRPRADVAEVALAALVVVASAAGAAAGWSRAVASAGTDRSVAWDVGGGWRRLARAGAVSGVLLGTAALASGKSTFLLVVCVVLAPSIAVGLWSVVAAAAVRHRRDGVGSGGGMLFFAYLADRPVVPVVTTAIVAGLFAFPMTAILMISGLESGSGGGPREPDVPRPELAVYDGPQDLSSSDLGDIQAESGARRIVTWTLALLPAGLTGEQATAWVPVAPERAVRACATNGGRAASATASALCDLGFRGAAIAAPATVEVVLGRQMTGAERQFFSGGGALTLSRSVLSGGEVSLVPTSAVGAPAAGLGTEVPGRAALPGRGTRVSSGTPAVWVSADVYGRSARSVPTLPGGKALREGQQEAAVEFSGPVTVQLEQQLRRAIVTRVEVGDQEEFLATRLDATHVSFVRRVLDDFDVVALLLAVAVAVYGTLALGRELRSEQRVLDDSGLSLRASAAWRAGVVGASTAVGAAAALVTGAVCGVLIVSQEGGGGVPVSGWLDVAPVLGSPVLAAAVAVLLTAVRGTRSTAWGLGFVRE